MTRFYSTKDIVVTIDGVEYHANDWTSTTNLFGPEDAFDYIPPMSALAFELRPVRWPLRVRRKISKAANRARRLARKQIRQMNDDAAFRMSLVMWFAEPNRKLIIGGQNFRSVG